MDLELTGKRALVTGSSRGIGRAVARQLAAEGADVVVTGRREAPLREAAEELAAESGRRIIPVIADTGEDAAVRALVAAAEDALGGVDILVNNAARPGGQGPAPTLAQFTTEALWEEVNVKVAGYLRCAQAVAPLMIRGGWGRIVNVSGLAARQTGSIIGSIRNVGVAALTKNLADDLGPHGINVTAVHPGRTRTEATAPMVRERALRLGITDEEAEAGLVGATGLGRMVDAAEVAWLVAFLASPRSVAVNGDAIACGGGTLGAIHY